MKLSRAILIMLMLTLMVMLTASIASATTENGYLSGNGASNTFVVNAGSISPLNVTFNYPKGSAYFMVEVVGQDGSTVLGNFDLDDGNVIQLTGGGTFYLTIYSGSGAGYWSATY
jgi:hypothetical protein